MEPVSPKLAGGFFTAEPPGKPPMRFLLFKEHCISPISFFPPSPPNVWKYFSFLVSSFFPRSYIFKKYTSNSQIFCGSFPMVHAPNCPEVFLVISGLEWASLTHSNFIFFLFFKLEANYFTILYWFCRTSTWICNVCTHVPHPEPPSHHPPHTISLGHPSAPAPIIRYHASNLDWWFVSHMILKKFQCHSPKSSHPLPLPQSPKDCSIHLCLFRCLTYRVIVTIFLNSIYMC